MTTAASIDLLRHLAGRPGHDEVKADFRQLLVEEFDVALGALDFERRVPEVRGRLDALIGRTVFEAKSDLDAEWRDVERRMPDYLADREREEGEHFVGIASDGKKWAVFELRGEALVVVKRTDLDPDKAEVFLAWLDGALALKASLPPDPLTIRAELGSDSVAFHLVREALEALWSRLAGDPAQALKRQLWAELLKLVHGRDVDSDALWFQHSYLVIVAKCIALAVMDLPEDDPRRMLSGEAFSDAGIGGAVESDFFDWVVGDPEGEALVRRIMAHVRRFRLREVESDVLKILYESLIDRDERHGLGEYYTPDWLAAKVVRHAVDRPLEQKVLDPACGSGTFLFHAVRRVLAEAEEAGVPAANRAAEAAALVYGTDIHPVAVILARVTYLLALAPALRGYAGTVSIPVFLGDAMQLSVDPYMIHQKLIIRVPPPPPGQSAAGQRDANGREQLDFPDTFCRDPGLFDKAIERMRTASVADWSREQVEDALIRITEQHYKGELTNEQRLAIDDLGKTYVTFDRLRREGRDTIWAYVARNLSRPLALSAGGGWANVLVGNPPWVAYRNMSPELQARYKELATAEQAYDGRAPSQADLSALFVIRAAQLYLRSGGKLSFILPLAALSRTQFHRFRTGNFRSVKIAWANAWMMDRDLHPLFPVPSCVLTGDKRSRPKAVPSVVSAISGLLPIRDASSVVADRCLQIIPNAPAPTPARSTGGSPYRRSFRCGANLFPRVLVLVNRASAGRLGTAVDAALVESVPSIKSPWNEVEAIRSRVEIAFLRPVYLGESILPHRVFKVFEGVIPVDDQGNVLQSASAGGSGYDLLSAWLKKVEATWDSIGKGARSYRDQINYIGQLAAQFPIATRRVIYTKSGTLPAACILRDERAVVDQKLFWATTTSEEEAYYLVAVLNSEAARSRAERYQSRGLFGTRDFDKVMFNLPIPPFNVGEKLHTDLAAAGREAERVAGVVELVEGEKFQRARKRVRDALAEDGVGGEIEKLVDRLLGPA